MLDMDQVYIYISCVLCFSGKPRPPYPVYINLPEPTEPLPENYDLFWNDGTVQVPCIDFDMNYQSRYTTLAHFLMGLGGLFGSAFLISWFGGVYS